MKTHIFTIMAGCAPVGIKMLESYFRYHKERIHVYLFPEDVENFKFLIESGKTWDVTFHNLPDSFREDFLTGHLGTAKVWTRVIKQNPDSYLIQIDSDVIFKQESIPLISDAGYPDIYGSRRCYKNNPGGAKGFENQEDAISTYFIGFNPQFLGPYLTDQILEYSLTRMIQGTFNPLNFPVLDFFDPVFFYARMNGAKVYYENPGLIGGQYPDGTKRGFYNSNLHLDMGSHLAHFGGVGSGYQATKDDSKMNKDYSDWAKHRWNLFQSLFTYKNKGDVFHGLTRYDSMGRWISGPHDAEIWDQINHDLNN